VGLNCPILRFAFLLHLARQHAYGATDAAHACGLDSSPLAICADTANTRFPDLERSGRTVAVIFETGPAAPEGAGIEDNFFGMIPEIS
jgi:hypothetical protein